ncbi:hypothetical protein D3C87_85920 [compost metagenome]
MKPVLIILLAISSFSIAACKKKKKSGSEHEHASAVITITSPAENDTIQGNFVVTGTIAGTADLHGYQVTVTNTLNDSIIYQHELHDHVADFTINQSVNHGFTAYTPLKLVVLAAIDHDGNMESKTVYFTVH